MRTIPGYPDPHALVTSPVARVVWNGMVLSASEVSVTRGMVSGLPAQVAGGGGMMAATGSAVVDPFIGPVVEGLCLPTGDVRVPRPGDPVVIEMGLRDARGAEVYAPQLTGRVDSVSGTVGDGAVQISVVDRIDRLDRTITLDPLYHLMPPRTPGLPRQEVQLYYTFLLDRMARHCGFHAIPPMPSTGTSLVYAPLMGSAWPERGTALWSRPAFEGLGEGYTMWARSPWGLSAYDLDVAYEPRTGQTLSQPIYVSFLADIQGDGEAPLVDLGWTSGVRLRVQISATSLAVQTYGANSNAFITRASLSHSYTGQVLVSAWVYPTGQVRLQAGSTVGTGSIDLLGEMATDYIKTVRVYAYGTSIRIGAVRVGAAPAVFDLHDWTRTALMSFPKPNMWYIFPGLFGAKVLDVIKDWASATLGGGWLDEQGRLVLRHHYDLTTRTPVATLRVDQIDSAQWGIDWAAVKERVEIAFKRPVGQMRAAPFVQVWEGSNITLERGERHEELIHPPADEVWIGVADDGLRFAWHGVAAQVNSGRYSWVCAVTEDTAAGTETQLDSSDAAGGLYRIDGRTWQIILSAPGVPAGQQAHYRFPDAATWLKVTYRGKASPVVRAHGLFSMEDMVTESAARGPAGAGTLTHEAGWWYQHPESAQGLAETLASDVTAARHVYSGVSIAPDDRLQIGDIVDLDWGSKPDGSRWPGERALIGEIEHTVTTTDGGVERTMSVTLLPIGGAT